MVLEKARDRLGRSCEKCRSVTESQGGKEHLTYDTNKEG